MSGVAGCLCYPFPMTHTIGEKYMANPKLISMTIDGIPTTLVDDNGKYYVHLRPIIEDIGLSWKRQFAKLRAQSYDYDWRYYVSGRDEVFRCIALDDLTDFLGSVNPLSVAPAIARRLCYYQTEWLRKLKERLTPKVVTCGNDLYDILKAIGFSDALLQRIGIAMS